MKTIFATFLGILGFCVASPTTVVSAAGPNFIVIYTDDHGWADLGVHGAVKDVRTPHLDELARDGVIARHGYVTAPQCVPSRAGLLTGRFQARFGVESNASSLDGFNRQTTIAARLQKAGYVTAQFGKWHLGPKNEIPKHGFTHVFAQDGRQPFAANINLDGTDRPLGNLAPTEYHIDACSQAAAAIIERYKDRPFFLYVAYRAPHTPLDAPQHYKDRFPGPMPERRRAALGMLAAVDDGVGLITDTLKKHNLREKTLIFFIGDNGAPLKIHKLDSPLTGDPGGWDGSLNDPLNGEKGMLSEGGMHVPFLIAWPGTIPAGKTFEHPVSALDVAATLAALAALPVTPGDLDGVNLVPHLTGEIDKPPHDALCWRWIAQSAIREGNWKLLRGGDREYLYDLASDLEEKHNLAAIHPDIATRLRAKLQAWSDELKPPGLTNGAMAPVWNQYFDYYLEGKPAPVPDSSAEADAFGGWLCRNGTLAVRGGALIITPEPDPPRNARPFIANARIDLSGPVTVSLHLRTQQAGRGFFAWRTAGQKDFPPDGKAEAAWPAAAEPTTIRTELPVAGRLIHLRFQPADTRGLEILGITLRARDGKEQSWSFSQ
ncbi:MAG: sulfatase-like hydrolase/transferase [Thermogutta sp.]